MIQLSDDLRKRAEAAAAAFIASEETLQAAMSERRPPPHGARERMIAAAGAMRALLGEALSRCDATSIRARGRIWHMVWTGKESVLASVKEASVGE